MVTNLELIELDEAAGLIRLEWVSDYGVGASFQPETSDHVLSQVPETIRFAVWLNLQNTRITDAGLTKLEGAPVLESVRVAGSHVTNNGILSLLGNTPTIQEIAADDDQLGSADVKFIRKSWPRVVVKYVNRRPN